MKTQRQIIRDFLENPNHKKFSVKEWNLMQKVRNEFFAPSGASHLEYWKVSDKFTFAKEVQKQLTN